LYKAMTTSGAPPSPELRQLIESDPLLKQLAEDAGTSGDATLLQQELTRRTLETIRDNPDVFTPEDLEFLVQFSNAAEAAGQSPQTVEQLRKSIDAAKAGKQGGGQVQAGGVGKPSPEIETQPRKTEPAQRRGAGVGKKAIGEKEASGEISEGARDRLANAPAPVRGLLNSLFAAAPSAQKLSEADLDRFLDIVPAGLSAEQVAKLRAQMKEVKGETVEEILDALQVAVEQGALGAEATIAPDIGPHANVIAAGPPVSAPMSTPPKEYEQAAPLTMRPSGPGASLETEKVIEGLKEKAKVTVFKDLAPGNFRIAWSGIGSEEIDKGTVISGSLRGRHIDGKTTYVGRVQAEVTAVDKRNRRKVKIRFISATPMVSAFGKIVFSASDFLTRGELDALLDKPRKGRAK
jgi:hypothetical protein